jgi:hypothetical protein
LATIYFVRPVRKHYLWLAASLLPYLVIISIAPKKLSRYALPVAPLLVLFVGAAIEWLVPRLRALLKRFPLGVAASLSLLFTARYARAVSNLPEAQQCTHWPGSGPPPRPAEMYFMHDLALVIAKDWRGSGRRVVPSVYVEKPEEMAPWFKIKRAKLPGRADYVVVWDGDYVDAEAGKLTPQAESRFGLLSPALVTLRYSGRVVARLHRHADRR